MKAVALALTALLASSATPAGAEDDSAPSTEETASISAALAAMGCKGWDEIEKEAKAGGAGYHFEIDDTTCADGQYDIKLDKDFKLIDKSRD